MSHDIIPLIVYPVNAGYVNCPTPEFRGTGEPGSTINGFLNAVPFSALVQANGVWSHKAESPLADNTDYSMTVTQTSTDGTVSAPVSLQFRTDTKALVNHTVSFPANHQSINTTTPKISGTGKTGATIEALVGNAVFTTIVNQDSKWEIQVDKPLPEGFVSMEVEQKDMGNLSPALSVGFTIDTHTPIEPAIEKPSSLGFENNPKPVVSGKGEPGASIDAVVDDQKYTAAVNQSGDWSFEISQTLIDDSHIIGARQIDAAGNISPENTSIFTVDTKQPGAPEVVSHANGSSISDNHPTIVGRGEKGCRIEVQYGDKVYSCFVGENNTWTLKIEDVLNDGMVTLRFYQISQAGNVSPYTPLTVKVDTQTPLAPVILYPEDGGYVNSIGFQVRGTGEPDAQVECTVAGKKYTAKVQTDGSFTADIRGNENLMEKQSYSVFAKQTDLAGNESPSARAKFTVDTQCLDAPTVTSPLNLAIINTVAPVFAGKARAGATVSVNIGQNVYSAKTNEDGHFEIKVTQNLTQGEAVANVYQHDKGNVSNSTCVRFTVDTVAPAKPQIDFPYDHAVLQDKNVVVRGSGEAGGTIEILLDDKQYDTDVKNDGKWEFTVPEPPENGVHAILATQTDSAGNKGQSAWVYFITNAMSNVQPQGKPVEYSFLYNPAGPDFSAQTILTLKTNVPVTIENVCGVCFSRIICENGIHNFDYTDAQGRQGRASAGVTWIDNRPPVIVIEPKGHFFSSDKTVTYFKPLGSQIKNALLNGVPFQSGITVTTEGTYKVEVTD